MGLKVNSVILLKVTHAGDCVKFRKISLFLPLLRVLLVAGLLMPTICWGSEDSDKDVPYGVASNWLYGRHLLAEGNVDEALRYLHFAYRSHPDVPTVAWDFQEGLVAGQFYRDALEVLDKLVTDWPDSALFRFQRSQVNMSLGNNQTALKDLQELRRQGKVDLNLVVGEATIYAEMGKIDQALDVCREGISILPEQGPHLYLTMSVILDQEGRRDELPPLLQESVAAYPNSYQLRQMLIRGLLSLGKDAEALEAARQADRFFSQAAEDEVPLGPEDQENPEIEPGVEESPPSFVIELADVYAQKGTPEKAVDILEPMFEDGTLAKNPSLWLARLHLGTGQLARGQEVVNEILEKWPHTGQAWYLRGQGLDAQGHPEDAMEAYAKAVRWAPNDAQVRMGFVRGILLNWDADIRARSKTPEQEKKFSQLKQQVDAAVLLIADGDAEGQLILGYAFRSTSQLKQAVTAFEKAAQDPGLYIPASLQLSVCLDDLGEEDRARDVLERLREHNPNDAEVANSLGYYLAEKGQDLDFAEKLIKQALKTDPGTGAYLDSMGWVLFQKGNSADAFDFIIQAVNVLPDDPVILEHLGLVLLDLGQEDEGEEMLRRALALGGDEERLQAHLSHLTRQEAE